MDKEFNGLIRSLPQSQTKLYDLVGKALKKTEKVGSPANRRGKWEFLLKLALYDLAAQEGTALQDPNTKYHSEIESRLDLVLAFAEHDAIDEAVPLTILEDVLEMQTIASCTHTFAYLQSNASRLTKGLVPQKGRALILLRTLNDLLRRLSKTGQGSATSKSGEVKKKDTETQDGAALSGRILCFLSDIFHLGERSGVNFRGEYGPAWEAVGVEVFDPEAAKKVQEKEKPEEKADEEKEKEEDAEIKEQTEEGTKESKMDVDSPADSEAEKKKAEEAAKKKADLFKTFWSLQAVFARPSLFAVSSKPPTPPSQFERFKAATEKVMLVLREANVRDRVGLGSRNAGANSNSSAKSSPPTAPSASLKRKREAAEDRDLNLGGKGEEYFFAKFLTNSDLLDLQMADPLFRRQILIQLIILCTHLLTFTMAAKKKWCNSRNKSLQLDFTLEPEEEKFCMSTVSDCYSELRGTYPNGSAFAQSAAVIMEREQNWIKWKNNFCKDFRKPPAYFELEDTDDVAMDGDGGEPPEKKVKKMTIEEATKAFRATSLDPEPWKWQYGTEPLSEIWTLGYRGLGDLESHFSAGEPRDFLKQISLQDMRIDNRVKQLERQEAMKRQREEQLRKAREEAVAKAEAEKMDVDPAVSTAETEVKQESPAPAAATSVSTPEVKVTPSSAHPSLPAKPLSGGEARALSANAPEFKPRSLTPDAGSSPQKEERKSSTPATTSHQPTTEEKKRFPAKRFPQDNDLKKLQETKDRLAWLALRAARDTHLKYFGFIGTGDVASLVKAIDNPEDFLKKREMDDEGKEASKEDEVKKEEKGDAKEKEEDAKKEESSSGQPVEAPMAVDDEIPGLIGSGQQKTEGNVKIE